MENLHPWKSLFVMTALVHHIQFIVQDTLIYDRWCNVRIIIMSNQSFIVCPRGTRNMCLTLPPAAGLFLLLLLKFLGGCGEVEIKNGMF